MSGRNVSAKCAKYEVITDCAFFPMIADHHFIVCKAAKRREREDKKCLQLKGLENGSIFQTKDVKKGKNLQKKS